jgi:serine/threonine protein kinase
MNARLQAPPLDAPPPDAPVVIAGPPLPLPEGAPLRGWRVSGVLGQGGFGIVYRADDGAGGPAVAIKEYLPAQLAARREDGSLGAVAPGGAETYAAGLRAFVEEARLLARVRHPALVEVLDAWEEQGTAYMAMPLYEGPTLERVIACHPDGLDEAALRAIAEPLLGALAALHATGTIHRDVAPDNVILRPDAGAVLLDLGAARREIGDRVRATTVMLKAGYAPIEQYAHDPDCPVGPWSDVYALGAMLHHAACGEAPPPSPMRVMRDTRVALSQRSPDRIGPQFCAAIDAAMALRPEDRPATAAALRERLGLAVDPLEAARAAAEDATVHDGTDRRRRSGRRAADRSRARRILGLSIATVAMLAVLAVSVGMWLTAEPPSAPSDLPIDERAAVLLPPDPSGGPASGPAAARPAPPKPATLRLSVSPWAEVWVDGSKRAVTPPTMSIPLAPGERRIELRNPGGETVVRRLDAKAGQTLDLNHRFTSPEKR